MTKIIASTYIDGSSQLKTYDNLFIKEDFDQVYYGHGKLLISGEYFVLDGACALAVPLKLGQSLGLKFRPSYNPKLHWKSLDNLGRVWFEAIFDFWHFDCSKLIQGDVGTAIFLQKILNSARLQNSHFLREGNDVYVETHLEFPLDWGLGSSSTLLYNIAQWAYISPFELLKKTFGGSGYDIACSQSSNPLIYVLGEKGPSWTPVNFSPLFSKNLYFLYLGKKQNSASAVKHFNSKVYDSEILNDITQISLDMIKCRDFLLFEALMKKSEELVSKTIFMTPVQNQRFSDFWGSIKSLGAWGGDFAFVSSDRGFDLTKKYFQEKGLSILLRYDDLILPFTKIPKTFESFLDTDRQAFFNNNPKVLRPQMSSVKVESSDAISSTQRASCYEFRDSKS